MVKFTEMSFDELSQEVKYRNLGGEGEQGIQTDKEVFTESG